MSKSIVQKYMDANDLNQNQVAAAAGLARNAIQRQVSADFDGITMRTIKLLANVLEKTPQQVFADLYALTGGINDYSEDAGLYTTAWYTTDGASLTPDETLGDFEMNLHQALIEIGKLQGEDIPTNRRVDVLGGSGDGIDNDDIITVSFEPDGASYCFEGMATEPFKSMWREVMAANYPDIKEA